MIKRIILTLFCFSILSCKNQNKEKKVTNIKNNTKESFFSSIDSVRLISYPSKMSWDKKEIINDDEVDFEIPKEKIIDNVILEKDVFNKIKKILESDIKNGLVAACYEPRHMFQFYTKGKIIGFYEVCLECGGAEYSSNFKEMPPFCIEKGEKLKEIFIKLRLKNIGEGSQILDELEDY